MNLLLIKVGRAAQTTLLQIETIEYGFSFEFIEHNECYFNKLDKMAMYI